MSQEDHIKIRPDAARVWRGFMIDKYFNSEKGVGRFRDALRKIFIPITAQAMSPLGLTAYLPTILRKDKCSTLPHEIALVFYKSQNAYKKAMGTTIGKAYGMLHGTVFNFDRNIEGLPWSTSAFPVLFGNEFKADEPYYLYDEEIDWQHGETGLFVGARKDMTEEQFLREVDKSMTALQKNRPAGLSELIFVASGDYLIYWTQGEKISSLHKELLPELRSSMRKVVYRKALRKTVESAMHEPIDEIDACPNRPLNLQFIR